MWSTEIRRTPLRILTAGTSIFIIHQIKFIDGFKVKLYDRARLKLIETVSKEFRLEEEEAIVVEMSRLMDVKDYKAISKKAEIFEQAIQKLGQLTI